MNLRFRFIPLSTILFVLFLSSCWYKDVEIIRVENNSADTIEAFCFRYNPDFIGLPFDSIEKRWQAYEMIEPGKIEQLILPKFGDAARRRHAWKSLNGRILLYICTIDTEENRSIVQMRFDLTEEQAEKMHWVVKYPEDGYLSLPLDSEDE